MVNRSISLDIKHRALYLQDIGWKDHRIADALGVHITSIHRWRNNVDTFGCTNPKSYLVGRPSILSYNLLEDIENLIHDTPSLYLDEISLWLAIHHDTPISLSTLHRNLREIDLSYKIIRRNAAQRDEEEREAWMEDTLANYSAEQMVSIDESSKDGRTMYRKRGRAPRNERAVEIAPFERGERYSILPALTVDGYIAMRVVPGSVNGLEFFNFLVEDLLPKMNPFPLPRSVLLLDNCPTHKSEAVRLAVEAAGCVLLFLPPYSPDFNPIEESFSAVKAYLRRHWKRFVDSENPEMDLLEASFRAVTPEKAVAWFRNSGYV